LKPLHIVQPEGVSFKIDGHVLEWQGWKMHVCGWFALEIYDLRLFLCHEKPSLREKVLLSPLLCITTVELYDRFSIAFPWRRWLSHTLPLNFHIPGNLHLTRARTV
jgi:hypothetical protein